MKRRLMLSALLVLVSWLLSTFAIRADSSFAFSCPSSAKPGEQLTISATISLTNEAATSVNVRIEATGLKLLSASASGGLAVKVSGAGNYRNYSVTKPGGGSSFTFSILAAVDEYATGSIAVAGFADWTKTSGDYGWQDGGSKNLSVSLPVHEHAFIHSSHVIAADCDNPGEDLYTCSCGKTARRAVAAKGHDWQMGQETMTNCEEGGTRTDICRRCQTSRIVAIGQGQHVFGSEQINPTPTCTDSGLAVSLCTRCGSTKMRIIEATGHAVGEEFSTGSCLDGRTISSCCPLCTKTFVIKQVAPAEHNLFLVFTQPATCDKAETQWEACKTCREEVVTQINEALGHRLTIKEKQNATCSTPGWVIEHCDRCKRDFRAELPIIPHIMGTWQLPDGFDCLVGGRRYQACDNCPDVNEEEVSPQAHVWHIVDETDSDCLTAGQITSLCNVCGAIKKDEKPLAQHMADTFVVDIPSTCIKAGTEKTFCTVCQEPMYRDLPLSEAHEFSDWTTTDGYDCMLGGTEKRECALCPDSEERPIAPQSHDLKDMPLPAGFSCPIGGTQSSLCQRCGHTEDHLVPPAEHQWKLADGTIPPTCTMPGVDKMVCQICSSMSSNDTLPTGHKHRLTKMLIEQNCEHAGRALYECSQCADNYTVDFPQFPHQASYDTVIQALACLQDGIYEGVCATCGQTVRKVTKQMGHDYVPSEGTPATCTTPEIIMSRCRHCAAPLATTLFALGHDFSTPSVTTPASCSSEGMTETACSRCDEKITIHMPSLKHAYRDAVLVSAATCEQEAKYALECILCGEIEHKATPALGHHFGPWGKVTTEDCELGFTQSRHCTKCEAKDTRHLEERTHWYARWITLTGSSCTVPGERIHTCRRCGADHLESLPLRKHRASMWFTTKRAKAFHLGVQTRKCRYCGSVMGTRYYTLPTSKLMTSACLLGPRIRDEKADLTQDWFRYLTIDLAENVTRRVPLVADDKHIIGFADIKVGPEELTITTILSDPRTRVLGQTGQAFDSLDDISPARLAMKAKDRVFNGTIALSDTQKAKGRAIVYLRIDLLYDDESALNVPLMTYLQASQRTLSDKADQ